MRPNNDRKAIKLHFIMKYEAFGINIVRIHFEKRLVWIDATPPKTCPSGEQFVFYCSNFSWLVESVSQVYWKYLTKKDLPKYFSEMSLRQTKNLVHVSCWLNQDLNVPRSHRLYRTKRVNNCYFHPYWDQWTKCSPVGGKIPLPILR